MQDNDQEYEHEDQMKEELKKKKEFQKVMCKERKKAEILENQQIT